MMRERQAVRRLAEAEVKLLAGESHRGRISPVRHGLPKARRWERHRRGDEAHRPAHDDRSRDHRPREKDDCGEAPFHLDPLLWNSQLGACPAVPFNSFVSFHSFHSLAGITSRLRHPAREVARSWSRSARSIAATSCRAPLPAPEDSGPMDCTPHRQTRL